ncbi:MAG: fused MFS/spermidine synthase [Acidobacteriaceae bacterium]|nr:fused MFS/spermidine synthase [Acidobacteriaceae bacterium]
MLFSLEPIVAKRILPWFGGTAAVWATCLVFFQTVLLAGYAYSQQLSLRLSAAAQRRLHTAVLACSLLLLPIGPASRWATGSSDHPIRSILLMLALSIGLPFTVLSATSPLLQHWAARSGLRAPYKLFALSNAASFAALFAYPLLIEPRFSMREQRVLWSAAYVWFAGVCIAAAWSSRSEGNAGKARERAGSLDTRNLAFWLALSACGSMLLLSVTNYLTQNVAPVPLLWILPLATYLMTFIVAFSEFGGRSRPLWLRVLAFGLGVLGYAIYDINAIEAIPVAVPALLAGLFAGAMFCHSELYRRRPDPSNLTTFYVAITAGGAIGAVFVGLIAPQFFKGLYELPFTLVVTAGLALLVSWPDGWNTRLLWAAMTAGMAAVFIANVRGFDENALTLVRSFYGSLRVVQTPHAGPMQSRTLYNGTIEHGAQFVRIPGRLRPTTYYGPDSGVGILLRDCSPHPKRVGVVGLGVGTVAAYGDTGDTFRFYEINPQVEDIAGSLFFYLRETKAKVEIVTGDARLSLERETPMPFDVLALDAFSGDAVPVHLLTREAFELYRRHLKPDGVLAFHVSNQYLDLADVVRTLAEQAGYRAVLVHNHVDEDSLILAADWVLVTRNSTILQNEGIKHHTIPFEARRNMRIWTDDYNNLFQVLKMPGTGATR